MPQTSPKNFIPLIADELTQAQDAQLPNVPASAPEADVSSISRQEIAQAWENLYYEFPSDGLKSRVLEAQEWARKKREEEW